MPAWQVGVHIGSGGFGSAEQASLLGDRGNLIETGLAQNKLLAKSWTPTRQPDPIIPGESIGRGSIVRHRREGTFEGQFRRFKDRLA